MTSFSIGQISKAAGVKVTTIRYYESIGVMGEPERSFSGQRRYDFDSVNRLIFIRHARDLGFSMPAIRSLIALQTTPYDDCTAIDKIAQEQLADVRKRLDQLVSLEKELERIVTACEGGRVASCRVIAALGNHDACLVDTHERITAM